MVTNATIPVIDTKYNGQTWLPKQDFINAGLTWRYQESCRTDEVDFLDLYVTGVWSTLDSSGKYLLEISEKAVYNDEPNCDNPKYNDPKYRVSGYTHCITDIEADEPIQYSMLPGGPLYVFSELFYNFSQYIAEQDLIVCDPILVLDESGNYGYLIRSDRVYPWRDTLVQELAANNETWDDIVASNPPMGSWVDFHFPQGGYDYNGTGPAFMVWTNDYIYFSTEHEFGVSIINVPRNPSNIPLERHV